MKIHLHWLVILGQDGVPASGAGEWLTNALKIQRLVAEVVRGHTVVIQQGWYDSMDLRVFSGAKVLLLGKKGKQYRREFTVLKSLAEIGVVLRSDIPKKGKKHEKRKKVYLLGDEGLFQGSVGLIDRVCLFASPRMTRLQSVPDIFSATFPRMIEKETGAGSFCYLLKRAKK